MNDQIPPPDKSEPDATVSPSPRRSWLAGAFSSISITQLMLVSLAAIFIWQWLEGHRAINDMQVQLAQKIAEMGGGSKANQTVLTQNQEQVRELSARFTALEARYAEMQNQRAAKDADLSAIRSETALAEVEQMLLMAEQHLQLSGNVKAALIAIQSADDHLQRMNRPAFDGLRKLLSQDMDKLRALPSVDMTGINKQLNKLIAAVDGLPLAYQQHAAREAVAPATPPKAEEQLSGHPDETAWQKLLREIWQEAKQLVRIEDTGKDEIPLLTPDQEFFLRENLKLHLLSARIALLSRDENTFIHELKTAQLWTTRYFDAKSNESVRMLAALKKLAASDISIELPDINPSLQAVRKYRSSREKTSR